MEIKKSKPIIYLEKVYETVLSQDILNTNFGDDDLLLVSDYSGDRKEDNFYVHSFLITSIPEGAMHIHRMLDFRTANPGLPNNSFFEFKSINQDKLRRRLLPKFLTLSDNIDGLLFVFLIEKHCSWLGKSDGEISKRLKKMDFGNWVPHISRKMLTTFILAAFYASKMPKQGGNLSWLSDRDSRIGDNKEQQDYSMEVFKRVFSLFDPPFKNIYRYSLKGGSTDEDLNSVVDIAAGFLLDVLDHEAKHIGSIEYADWFFLKQAKLKKRCFRVFEENGQLRIQENRKRTNA